MFKYNYTKSELDNIEKELYLTPFQRRIIEYRMLDYSLVKMSSLEHCCIYKISKEFAKINNKLKQIQKKN
jgi:hypothetical protein